MKESILFKNPRAMMEHILNISENYKIYNIAVKLLARQKTQWYTLAKIQIDDLNLYLNPSGESMDYFPLSLIEEIDIRYKKTEENHSILRFDENLRMDNIYLNFLITSHALDKLNLFEYRLKDTYK